MKAPYMLYPAPTDVRVCGCRSSTALLFEDFRVFKKRFCLPLPADNPNREYTWTAVFGTDTEPFKVYSIVCIFNIQTSCWHHEEISARTPHFTNKYRQESTHLFRATYSRYVRRATIGLRHRVDLLLTSQRPKEY